VFVIHRRPVLSDGGRGPLTHAYFILQDKIYMAPNLYDIAQTRLRNATYLLERSFADLEKNRPAANPRATGQWLAVARDEKDKKKDEEKNAEGNGNGSGKAGSTGTPANEEKEGSVSSQVSGPTASGPDWHLFHALTATRAALGDIDKLAGAPPPAFDEAAEARAMEAMAAAAVGRPVSGGAGAQGGGGAPGGSAPSVAPLPGTRAQSLAPTTPAPLQMQPATPSVYAPSPLRRAGMPFPTESPAPV